MKYNIGPVSITSGTNTEARNGNNMLYFGNNTYANTETRRACYIEACYIGVFEANNMLYNMLYLPI